MRRSRSRMLTFTCTVARCRSAVGTTCRTRPAEGGIGIGVEGDPGALAVADPGDVGLVDVHLHLQRGEVRHGHHRAAGEPAAHRGRHDLAHLRLLAQHRPGERGPDQGGLECRLGKAERRLRRLHPRGRRVDPGHRLVGRAPGRLHLFFGDQVRVLLPDLAHPPRLARQLVTPCRGLDQLRPHRGQIRLRLGHLRGVLGVVQSRDHLPLPHQRAFTHPELRQPARQLGRDRGPGAGHDVAVGGDAGAGRFGGATIARGRHREHLDRDRPVPPQVKEPRDAQGDGHQREHQIAPQGAAEAGRRGVTVDAQPGEVGGGTWARSWNGHGPWNVGPVPAGASWGARGPLSARRSFRALPDHRGLPRLTHKRSPAWSKIQSGFNGDAHCRTATSPADVCSATASSPRPHSGFPARCWPWAATIPTSSGSGTGWRGCGPRDWRLRRCPARPARGPGGRAGRRAPRTSRAPSRRTSEPAAARWSAEPLTLSLTRFDCVTLVESCLAIGGSAGEAGPPTWEGLGRAVERMRYRGGERRGYGSRLHYFSEWIAEGRAARAWCATSAPHWAACGIAGRSAS